jgi:predicted small secreted protein
MKFKKIIALIAVCACVLSGCQYDTPSTKVGGGNNANSSGASVNSSGDSGFGNVSVNGKNDSGNAGADGDSDSGNSGANSDSGSGNGNSGGENQTEKVKNSDEIVEIKEKMFVAQSNDIWYNTDDYMGKIIKYEGLLDEYTDPATGNVYYSVIRYGPGCCGVDANCGFEVKWEDETANQYPKAGDWCEVMGRLQTYSESGVDYLRINLTSLTVLEKRGEEYVRQ